jgi:hypothetical protein
MFVEMMHLETKKRQVIDLIIRAEQNFLVIEDGGLRAYDLG